MFHFNCLKFSFRRKRKKKQKIGQHKNCNIEGCTLNASRNAIQRHMSAEFIQYSPHTIDCECRRRVIVAPAHFTKSSWDYTFLCGCYCCCCLCRNKTKWENLNLITSTKETYQTSEHYQKIRHTSMDTCCNQFFRRTFHIMCWKINVIDFQNRRADLTWYHLAVCETYFHNNAYDQCVVTRHDQGFSSQCSKDVSVVSYIRHHLLDFCVQLLNW